MDELRPRPRRFFGYAAALATVAVAVLLRPLFVPLLGPAGPLMLLCVGVFANAAWGGIGPGLLASALSASAALVWFLPHLTPTQMALDSLLLFGIGVLVGVWSDKLRRGRARAEQAALSAELARVSEALASRAAEERLRLEHAQDISARVEADQARSELERRQMARLEERVAERTARLQTANQELQDEVADRLRAEDTLRRSEEKFRKLLESAPDAMVITDREGRITLANSQTEQLFAYAAEELVGQDVELLVPARFRGRYPGLRERFLSEPRLRESGAGIELYGLRKDGVEFPVEISLSPIETEEGLLVVSAIRDLSERRRAEAERTQLAREQVARSAAERGERRYRILAEASEIMAGSLDYEETLARVARVLVPDLADACLVHVLEESGVLKPLVVTHDDPRREVLLRELTPAETPDHSEIRGVVRTGEPRLSRDEPDAFVAGYGSDQPHRLMRLDVRSYLVVPLPARGRALGTLTLLAAGARRLGERELDLAQEIAQRAAVAVDNARLYRRGAGRQPAEGRVPGHALARAAHAAQRDRGLGPPAAERPPAGRGGAGARDHRQERDGAEPADRRHARRLAHRHRQAAPQPARRRAGAGGRRRARVAAARRRRQGDPDGAAGAGRRDPRARRPGPAAAGRVEPALERDQVHAAGRPGGGAGRRVPRRRRSSRCGTRASASAPSSCRSCSSASARRTPRPRAGTAAWGSGWRIVRHLAELHGGSVAASSDGEGSGATFTIQLPLLSARRRARGAARPDARGCRPRRGSTASGCSWWRTRPTRAS